MKCPNCGKEIADDSLFCESCGAQIKKNASPVDKSIDLRWALLIAMAIATIAMYFALNSYLLISCGQWDNTTLWALIIPICLFIITCWFCIKKVVPLSFLIVMGLFLTSNCILFHASIHTNHVYQYETKIDWEDREAYTICGIVNLSTPYNYYIKDEYKAREDLKQMRLALTKVLEQEGKNVYKRNPVICNGVEDDGVILVDRYYPSSCRVAYIIVFVSFILYIIYTIIAYKKGWKF